MASGCSSDRASTIDRDEIATELLRYGDANGDGWADVIDTLTMYPDARRKVVRLLAVLDRLGADGRAVRVALQRAEALARLPRRRLRGLVDRQPQEDLAVVDLAGRPEAVPLVERDGAALALPGARRTRGGATRHERVHEAPPRGGSEQAPVVHLPAGPPEWHTVLPAAPDLRPRSAAGGDPKATR